MTDAASKLLATFESLSPEDQRELLVELLRRSGELLDTALSDDALTGLADDVFQRLDAEESNGTDAEAR
jgi:hypothetical protein